jgi:hypothetical protein
MFAGFYRTFAELDFRIRPARINGQPGTLNFDGEGRLVNVFVFDIADGVIHTIRSIINPDKLGHLGYPLSPLARAGGRRAVNGVTGRPGGLSKSSNDQGSDHENLHRRWQWCSGNPTGDAVGKRGP